MAYYLFIFLLTAFLSFVLTNFFKWFAFKVGAIDYPDERKIHKKPIARLGGLAILCSFFIVTLIFLPLDKHILGLLAGSFILVIFGIIDDIKGLKPIVKIIGHISAALVIILSGIGIDFITNPFGGIISLDTWNIPISILGTTYHITVWSDLFTLFWVVTLINAINFLDGIDGLASGVSGIASFVIFVLSLSPDVNQPVTALLALILTGSAFGFLPLNFNPAKIFMGDSGSMFLGFVLAVLAIFSGGKIATALLILGLPIIDVLWAVLRRILSGKSPFLPDNSHLHHELLKRGLSQRKTVLFIYSITLIFGISALVTRSFDKLLVLVLLLIFTLSLILIIYSAKRT